MIRTQHAAVIRAGVQAAQWRIQSIRLGGGFIHDRVDAMRDPLAYRAYSRTMDRAQRSGILNVPILTGATATVVMAEMRSELGRIQAALPEPERRIMNQDTTIEDLERTVARATEKHTAAVKIRLEGETRERDAYWTMRRAQRALQEAKNRG